MDLFYIGGGGKAPQPSSQQKSTGAKPLSTGPKSSGIKASGGGVATSAPKAKTSSSATTGASQGSSDEQTKQLQNEISEMKLNMDTLEKERDFYFSKLRDIEVLL